MLGLVFAVLVANWVVAVGRFQVNGPIWDQWDFMNPLFEQKGAWALFDQQHGPHRQGVAFVLTSWVLAASDWDQRVESLWIVALLAGSALLALRLKRRLTGTLTVKDAWIVVAVLAANQADTVIIVPNASHSVFPLLLLLGACNLWLHPKPRIRYPLAGIVAVGLLFTGFGLFAGLVLTGLLAAAAARSLIDHRRGDAAWATLGLAIAIVGITAFAHDYVFEPASEGFRFPFDPWTDYGRFVVLMLAHAAGLSGASPFAYLIGTLILTTALIVAIAILVRWIAARQEPLVSGTYLLLVASSLMFAFNAAVGRVHLGVEGGMVSRYLTLLIPLALALGMLGMHASSPWVRRMTAGGVWLFLLAPYLLLAGRPLADWPGTAGMSDRLFHGIQEQANSRQAWISTYLATGDWRAADAAAGPVMHPAPEAARLPAKLAWMRERKLSFFTGEGTMEAFAPWLGRDGAVWLDTHDDEGGFRWMPAKARLWIYVRRDAFANIEVVGVHDSLPASARLRFKYLGQTGEWVFNTAAPVFSLPVAGGVHLVEFESLSGASLAGPNDSRHVSFQMAAVRLSDRPLGSEWALSADGSRWQMARGWRPLSGLYAWEGTNAWSAEKVAFEVTARLPSYLNLHVRQRFGPVATGPIEVSVEGIAKPLEFPDSSLGLSLRLSGADTPYRIEVRNLAGARVPAELGLSADTRTLALRWDRITVDATPAYPEVSFP